MRVSRFARLLGTAFFAASMTFGLVCEAGAVGTLTVVSSATYSDGTNGESYGVATDTAGNVFVTGYVNGSNDAFTIKYDNNLQVVSSATYVGGSWDACYAIAVDTMGSVFVVGDESGDILAMKYDNNLQVISSSTYADTDWANGVTVDKTGNIFVTGLREVDGAGDFFTIKYDNSLQAVSTAAYDYGESDIAYGVATDAAGNIFVTGRQDSGSGYDFLTIKYDNSLQFITSTTYSAGSEATGVAVDASGNVFVFGSEGANCRLIKYTNSLAFVSSALMPGAVPTRNNLTVDAGGNIYASMSLGGNAYFQVVKYDNDLQVISSGTVYMPNNGDAKGMAVDASGNIFVTGYESDGINTCYFTVKFLGPPTVTSVTPDAGLPGDVRSVAVKGQNFAAGSQFSFGAGITVNSVNVACSTRAVVNITITPAASAGSRTVTVTNLDGSASAAASAFMIASCTIARTLPSTQLILLSSAAFNSTGNDWISGVATDSMGAVYAVGTLSTASFDIGVMKFDKNLQFISSACFGGASGQFGQAVCVGRDGNVFVAGYNGSPTNVVVIKYDANLNFISSAAFKPCYAASAFALGIDASDNIILGGWALGSAAWDADILALKYDANLNFLSSATFNAGFTAVAQSLAIDGSGNIFMAGYRQLTSGAAKDFVTVKFDRYLTSVASATYDGGLGNRAYGVAVDPSGNVYVAGYRDNGTDTDALIIKYDNSLHMLGSAAFDSGGDDSTYGMASDAQGHIFAAAGLGIASAPFATLQYDSGLALKAAAGVAGDAYDGANAVTTDHEGNIITGGQLTVDGNPAFFVAKYASVLEKASTGTVVNSTGTVVDPAQGAEVQLQPESGAITVGIPAGAFGQFVTMTVATVTVPASSQTTVKVTNIGIEITNNAGLQPNKDITITLYYRDADITGLEESKLTLARYDNGRWIPIPTIVYADQNKLVGTVKHLSTFAVVQLAPAADLAGVKVYPNPFNPRNGALTLANLTTEADIKIYNVAGELVRTLSYTSANGQAAWDGKNDGGSDVASGVYLAFIKSSAGKKIIKIAVEK